MAAQRSVAGARFVRQTMARRASWDLYSAQLSRRPSS
jgi:hypothetical protein